MSNLAPWPTSNPLTPPQNEGFLQYSWDSFTMGLSQLGGALHNDLQGAFDQLNAADPTAPEYQGTGWHMPVLSFLDSIDPTSPTYDPATGSKFWRDALIIGGIVAVVALSPTINSVSAGLENRRA